MDEMRFDGRVAIVTGAGGGLGREYALLLASRGAKVVVNDLGTSRYGEGSDAGLAGKVVDEIRAAGGEAVANGSSVASREGCAAIARTALDNYGSIDILIHNATINRPGPFRDMTYEDFSEVLDVHVGGAFHLAKEAFPRMCDAGYGRIVLVSSIAGLYGDRNIAAYSTGKGAVIGLTRCYGRELGDKNIQVNAIAPGLTESEGVKANDGFNPFSAPTVATRSIKREMVPEDLLGTLLYLCTSDSDFVTGQTLNVDGGKSNV